MKCEDFLSAQGSDGRWQRWQARRHAQRCPRCSAAAQVDADLRQELSRFEPLSPALRDVWERAADEAITRPPRVTNRRSWAIPSIAAAVLVAMIGLWALCNPWSVAVRPKQVVQNEVEARAAPSSPVPIGQPIDVSAELDELLARVDDLQREIQAIAKQAELLDARQQAERMIATYNRW